MHPGAKLPLKGKAKGSLRESAKMTDARFEYYNKEFERDIATKKAVSLSEKNQIKGLEDSQFGGSGGCPSGQRMYRTKGLFGIGARDIGCMTAYEAESLRRQQVQNIQRNIQNSQPRNCYGTATSFGNTTYGNATCY